MEKLAFTITEAAKAAGVSRPTIYRWTHIQGFPVVRIGGCTRIPAKLFEQWINQQAGVTESA